MTIGEANEYLRVLLDEETLDEYKSRIMPVFDMAQVKIATSVAFLKKIIDVSIDEDKIFKMPDDFFRLEKVMDENLNNADYKTINEKTIFLTKGNYKIEYSRLPEKINDKTNLESEFEIDRACHLAICYFAAAEMTRLDNDQRPFISFIDEYNSILQNYELNRQKGAKIRFIKN